MSKDIFRLLPHFRFFYLKYIADWILFFVYYTMRGLFIFGVLSNIASGITRNKDENDVGTIALDRDEVGGVMARERKDVITHEAYEFLPSVTAYPMELELDLPGRDDVSNNRYMEVELAFKQKESVDGNSNIIFRFPAQSVDFMELKKRFDSISPDVSNNFPEAKDFHHPSKFDAWLRSALSSVNVDWLGKPLKPKDWDTLNQLKIAFEQWLQSLEEKYFENLPTKINVRNRMRPANSGLFSESGYFAEPVPEF